MAKQIKVDPKKDSKKQPTAPKVTTRSPRTNLIFAALLGLVFLTLFQGSPQGAFIYAVGAFLFFNTVDYCILYYRLNKKL